MDFREFVVRTRAGASVAILGCNHFLRFHQFANAWKCLDPLDDSRLDERMTLEPRNYERLPRWNVACISVNSIDRYGNQDRFNKRHCWVCSTDSVIPSDFEKKIARIVYWTLERASGRTKDAGEYDRSGQLDRRSVKFGKQETFEKRQQFFALKSTTYHRVFTQCVPFVVDWRYWSFKKNSHPLLLAIIGQAW